eukprot:snap_masked-scaffold_53-processed-gene-1.75-mRNA-1 protein AED:0.51 eAED:0.55 QI:0/0/0/1/1/1/2/0/317
MQKIDDFKNLVTRLQENGLQSKQKKKRPLQISPNERKFFKLVSAVKAEISTVDRQISLFQQSSSNLKTSIHEDSTHSIKKSTEKIRNKLKEVSEHLKLIESVGRLCSQENKFSLVGANPKQQNSHKQIIFTQLRKLWKEHSKVFTASVEKRSKSIIESQSAKEKKFGVSNNFISQNRFSSKIGSKLRQRKNKNVLATDLFLDENLASEVTENSETKDKNDKKQRHLELERRKRQSRVAEARYVEQLITEVSQSITRVSSLVAEQEELVSRIDDNVAEINKNVESGQLELLNCSFCSNVSLNILNLVSRSDGNFPRKT